MNSFEKRKNLVFKEKRNRFVRIPEILDRTGVKSRVTLYYWQKKNLFPKFRKIGPNTVGLPEDEFEKWLESRESV